MSTSPLHTSPKVEQGGNVTILTFSPEQCDGENVIARDLRDFPTESGDHYLLLNFINVKYLNSVGLGILINLHKRVQSAGGRLILFNVNTQLFQIFTTTRLDTLLTICREVSEAGIAALPQHLNERFHPKPPSRSGHWLNLEGELVTILHLLPELDTWEVDTIIQREPESLSQADIFLPATL